MKKLLIAIIALSLLTLTSLFSQTNIRLSKLWEIETSFKTPESAVFDDLRNCIYVSNFNDKGGFRNRTDTVPDEYISKVDLEGNIIELKWIDNLLGPTGITIHNDALFVVERGYLTKINIEKQTIIERIPIKNSSFLNDVVVDENGDTYLSDSKEKGVIYKIKDNKPELWLQDTILKNCNGLFIDEDRIIIGNQGSANLISVSKKDKTIKVLASDLAAGIDGIKKYRQNYIVSWRYEILAVNNQGNSQVILDTSDGKDWNADFELIKNKNMIIVPTLLSNKLVAYEVDFE